MIFLFLGLNVLSYAQLYIKNLATFEKGYTEVAVVRTKKKIVKLNMFNYTRYFLCVTAPEISVNEDGFEIDKSKVQETPTFLEDGIFVSGMICFSQIKEDQYVFIKRKYYDGYYKYFYVA